MIKQLLIPVAAFAVTVTAASAFNTDMLENLDIDLTDDQVSALEEAEEIRQTAFAEAKQVLEDAGIDGEKMREIHEAMHEARDERREAVHEALEADDYDAFMEAIAGSPLADAITSEADFETFQEAHELREAGDFEAAQELLSELGIERGEGMGKGFGGPGHHGDRQSAESQN